ncbi:GGDEF and EAL domain-containing protein [Sulfurivirga sp.]|uniref:GGDEF and EAL domain-containing protein n=1 Tax=Sulfurivirga sp. TaxID=2614236 RepID=UPI0025F0237C|nr:GGDEF and EAL domain-containing protein [Sulfurivirga sp.]
MSWKKSISKFFPLPSMGWIGLIALINALLIGGVIAWGFKDTNELYEHHRTVLKEQAEAELESAMSHTRQILENNARALADWEELQQQFVDPSYYLFWLKQSLPTSLHWLPVTREIILYTPDGRPLRAFANQQPGLLPEQLTGAQLHASTWLRADPVENRLTALIFAPVRSPNGQLLGHVGVAYDFVRALMLYNTLRLIRLDRLRIIRDGLHPFEKWPSLVRVRVEADPVATELLKLSQRMMAILAILLIGISLFNLWLFNRLFFSPMQTIAAQFLQLHRSKEQAEQNALATMPVREMRHLGRLLSLSHNRKLRMLEKLRKSEAHFRKLALTDLTALLPNREALKRVMEKRKGEGVLILMDILHFRALNNTYGPIRGDQLLREIGQTLRQLGAHQGFHAFRLSGDEFVLLLDAPKDEAELRSLINDLSRRVAEQVPQRIDLPHIQLRTVYGVTLLDDNCDFSCALSRANAALGWSKEHNLPFTLYSSRLDDYAILLDHELVEHIIRGVERGDHLLLYRQPVVNADGAIAYYELLVRMERDERILNPAELFKVVDRRHLHTQLDTTVIRKAAELLAREEIPAGTGVSINLNVQTLMAGDLDRLTRPLLPFLGHYTIVLEILETALIEEFDQLVRQLQTLRRHGFKIALDDFGSGYSSLRYLTHLPADTVKIDRSFSEVLKTGDSKEFLVMKKSLDAIHTAGYTIVFEGIETEQMYCNARKLGVEAMQGYYFSAPRAETPTELPELPPCPPDASSP